MSADEREEKNNDNLPHVLRLRSQGTFLAKSSDFTRDAAILHTTEIEVDIQGMHEGNMAGRDGSAGVGFVSAKTRLDRIFQKDFDAKGSAAKPPPPPPPPPPPAVRSNARPSSAHESVEDKTVVSIGTDMSSVIQKANAVSRSHKPPTNIVAPPPIEGMYFRSPTRHVKLIKTRLSDLPAAIQDQEPQIRGGVAVYKVNDEVLRQKFGSMVEINATDYIHRLKDTIRDLERQLSVVQGILEKERESRQANKNMRGSIRMGTFMGRRTKDPDSKSSDKFKRSQKGKNGSVASGTASNASSAKGSPGSSISEHKNPGVRPRPPVPPVNFPRGFGFHPERVRESKLTPEERRTPTSPPKPRDNALVRKSSVDSNGELEVDNAKDDARKQPHISDSSLPDDNAQNSNVPNNDQMQTPIHDASTTAQSSVDQKSTDHIRTFHPRKPVQQDRNAAPMPGVEARRVRRGKAGRTKSFSSVPTDEIRKVSTYDYDEEKVSRAMSMHRESNAEPPPPTPATATKRSRGVFKLFGLRS